MNDNFLPIAYFQNKFVPFEDAKISIATVLYADKD